MIDIDAIEARANAASAGPWDTMDDAIDAWHALPSPPCPLHEWLGMTWDEYRAWAENPAADAGATADAAPDAAEVSP